MSGCEIIKCKWWRGTSQSCAEPSSVCIYQQQDAALASLKAEMQGHIDVGESLMKEVKRLDKEIAAAEKRERELRELLREIDEYYVLEAEHYERIGRLLGGERGCDD